MQDVCVKIDFDDLYNKITDDGRELRVIHGGVVEVTYQPVSSARNITLSENPFGTQLPVKPAPAQPDVPPEVEPEPPQDPAAPQDSAAPQDTPVTQVVFII